jgi:methylthioribose-1-phosphate isomerase
MNVDGKPYRSIWYDADHDNVKIIDQTLLPHQFEIRTINRLTEMAEAINVMRVRGAPLIGVSAAFGLYLALKEDCNSKDQAIECLLGTRPTAVNLAWAMAAARKHLTGIASEDQAPAALEFAMHLADEDVATCEAIGEHGSELLEKLWRSKADQSTPLNVLTHCNAGWLATVDWGTALSVLYKTQARGVPLHIWVDETRPRNQGAFLTTWELQQQGIDHSLIADNTGGHLMQQGMVDACVVGSDRTTASGDVCNKIGTYLKALAAHDNSVPFYVALPVSTIDFSVHDGLTQIPIEQRDSNEVLQISGMDEAGTMRTISLAHRGVTASNYAFDVTPARLVSGLITEQGVVAPDKQSIATLRH